MTKPEKRKDGAMHMNFILLILSFVTGSVLTGMVINNSFLMSNSHASLALSSREKALCDFSSGGYSRKRINDASVDTPERTSERTVLDGLRILVDIAAYDFSQLPHLEEVLDGYHELCVAGATVDVYIHATVAYPVTLIDLLNSRHTCTNPSPRAGFSITIVLKNPSVRLFLVNFHRPLFYEKIDEYDLFVYSEDDIRVTSRTIAAYIYETDQVERIVGSERASDFNVGIVRYEYSFPSNIVIDDKTRQATANATRVYWEHSWTPPFPKSVDAIPQKELSDHYIHMKNHHQGMFIATRKLLKAWKVRPGCRFDVIRDRPSRVDKPWQPTEGTQRVWMSSQMLFGAKHCAVQQLLPVNKFGLLTVLHLPNKNYRRVGRKGRLGGRNAQPTDDEHTGDEYFEPLSPLLLTEMNLHIEVRKRYPPKPQIPYKGIRMIDEVGNPRSKLLDKRMREYELYVSRGGVLSKDDMTKTSLFD